MRGSIRVSAWLESCTYVYACACMYVCSRVREHSSERMVRFVMARVVMARVVMARVVMVRVVMVRVVVVGGAHRIRSAA